MINTIANKMDAEAFENLKQRVIHMSAGVDDFVYTEMLNHRNSYDSETGMRKTAFVSAKHNWYSVVPVVTADQTVVNCEMAPICWQNMIEFLQTEYWVEKVS